MKGTIADTRIMFVICFSMGHPAQMSSTGRNLGQLIATSGTSVWTNVSTASEAAGVNAVVDDNQVDAVREINCVFHVEH